MKLILILMSFIFSLATTSVFAEGDDATMKKEVDTKEVQEAGDDSLLKKAAVLKKKKEIVDEDNDSAAEKALKLKAVDKVTE